MLEELRRHRKMVQERIQKSFESDGLDLNILKSEETEIFKSQETEDLFEKAKWNVGDEKVYQGVTYVVGGFNAKGTPLLRKKKDGGNAGTEKRNVKNFFTR